MSKSKIIALLSGTLFVVLLPFTTTNAAMIGTTELLNDLDRTQLIEKLQRSEVQQQLTEMGVDPQAAIKRVDSMSDKEIAEINGKLAQLPAGAGLSNVELLLIIIIIILLV